MSFLDELNEKQREAAETLTGPLLIIAGAGSGKTRALTYRIANIIDKKMAHPWQILAVTFTNKAAGEMKGRIEKLLKQNFEKLNPKNHPAIGTFHAICLRILRSHIDKLGRDKSFVIYDTTDTESVMKRLIKENQVDDDRIKPSMALGIISKTKNNLGTSADYSAHASTYFEKAIAKLFADYEERLKKNNALDFDDILLFTAKLFREHPAVLEEYQERWRYINVDEYQDTNHVQYVIIKLLANKYRNLCVIGDSDQSIYKFRGADIANILNFEKDYSEAKIIKLEQNYRSTQNILDVADSIIEKNKHRKPKKMWTDTGEGDLIEAIHASSETDEAETVAKEIESLLHEKKARLKDMVILYRTNAQSRVIEEVLLRYGIPYKVIGGVKFYARKEVKDLLAYLRVVQNPNDTDSLLRIINIPPRRIGDTTINKLQAFALGRSMTLGEILRHIEMVEELSQGAKTALSDFWNLITESQKLSKEMVVSDLLKKIVSKINYKAYLMDGTEEGEMRYENILELISVASKYDGLEPQLSLASFLEEVALVADTDSLVDTENVITMMTLHSVKGLEFPYVFIVGCEENIFPHSRSLFDQEELEEERRLMYVGVTRAMKKVYLLAAKQRMIYGDFQSNAVSRFLFDIPEKLITKSGFDDKEPDFGDYDLASNYRDKKISPIRQRFDEDEKSSVRPQIAEEKFADGDKVTHPSFGEGIVVERRGDLVTVAFHDKKFGIKKFAANIAPLEKI